MKYLSTILATLLLGFAFTSCDDDEVNSNDRPKNDKADEVTILANDFVYQIMDYYYLYNEGISKDTPPKKIPVIDYNYEKDTKEYFKKLLNPKDIFSFITDDASAFKKEQTGVSTSMGWEYSFMYADATRKNVVASIDYVYPGTPAYNAGARRGDFIFSINGENLTPDNYSNLWNKKGTYKGAHYTDNSSADKIEYSLTPDVINVSPVAETNIFTLEDGTKVGYLLYMNYYAKFNDELTKVFNSFKAEGVSRLILDLRYNPGGEMTACAHLTSLFAPATAVAAEKEIVHYEYNKNLAKEMGDDDISTFTKKVLSSNLDLKDVVIIQGRNSYSASEATILGLKPYMDVYTIGSTSGGKNTAMFVLTPDLFVNNKTKEPFFDKRINNWLIAPLVAVYYNSNMETFDTTDGDGMDPDFEYDEFNNLARLPLGDKNEALTALALEYIANGKISSSKSAAYNNAVNLIDVTDYKTPLALQIPFTLK
ncbi:MAG: S41 family peptidase [Bacteroidia bacterium]|nr:S41 family peptidase [Bacteroidia bacterium]